MGQGVGFRRARWQGRDRMAGDRKASWQLLGVVGQEEGGRGQEFQMGEARDQIEG